MQSQFPTKICFNSNSYNLNNFTYQPQFQFQKISPKNFNPTNKQNGYIESIQREKLIEQSKQMEKNIIAKETPIGFNLLKAGSKKEKNQVSNNAKVLVRKNVKQEYLPSISKADNMIQNNFVYKTIEKNQDQHLKIRDFRSKSVIEKCEDYSQITYLNQGVQEDKQMNNKHTKIHTQLKYICDEFLDFKITLNNQKTNKEDNSIIKQRYLPNYINFHQENFQKPYLQALEIYQNKKVYKNIFKLWGFILLFIFSIRKILKNKTNLFLQNLKEIRLNCNKIKKEEHTLILKDWSKKVIEKSINVLKSPKFSSLFKAIQTNVANSDNNKKIRRKYTSEIALIFFQNLEEMITKQSLPQQIIDEAKNQISLLQKKCCLFVANRIKKRINKLEQTLIICEYIFFQGIIQTIISESNSILVINQQHLAESKFQLVSLCSLLQIIFMEYFNNMNKFKNKTFQLCQKKLIVQDPTNQILIIEEDKNIDQSETIILGLNNQGFYENIINGNDGWYQKIKSMMERSIQFCQQNYTI